MDLFYYVPWYAWIAIIGVIGWLVLVIIGAVRNGKDEHPELTKALEENSAVNKALLEKLDAIDTRLAAVEKTLNDVPN